MDATYRGDLRELNELNFARFDAKLEQRLAELRTEFRTELVQRFADSDVRWERRLGAFRVSLIRWMVGLWTVGTLTVLGTTLAILKL